MMHLIRSYFTLTALLFYALLYSAATQAAAPSDVEALLLVSEQQVLSQRLLKNYAQIGQEVRFLAARSSHQESLARFESIMEQLKGYDDSAFTRLLGEMEAEWASYKKALQQPPKAERSVEIEAQAERLMLLAGRLQQAIISASNPPEAIIIRLVGSMIVASEHAAAHYLLASWDVDRERNIRLFKESVGRFDTNLITLSHAPENSRQTADIIRSLENRWALFKEGHRVDEEAQYPDFVIRMSDSISRLLEEAKGHYATASLPTE